MAATTIKTSTVYDSYFWVKWESGGQDVSANKTAINWSCGVTPGHKFYSNAVKMSAVSIGGVTVYAGGTYSNITDYKEHTFASGTLEVSHNADGSKTLTVSAFSGQVWKDSGYLTATAAAQSFQLAAIPRATEPVMGAATMGEAVRISLPRASSAFTHTMSYVFGAASGTIVENAGTEVQWTVPESLAAQIPDSSVGTGTLTCRTYNGGTLVGTKTVTFTATVPQSMKPALTNGWAAVSYDNSGTKASGIAAWVQGYSKAKAVFDSSKIACKQGASIAKYAVTYLGKTVEESPYRTETISTTSATVRCTVTDSRGLTAWEDVTVTLESYAPPMLVGASLYRSDGEGTAADSGTHIAGLATAKFSSIGGRNTATIMGYWKSVGGSYGEGVTLPFGAVGLVTGDVEIAADRSYTAKIVVTDSLGNSTEFEENIPTEQVAFHLKEGGNGAAFGKAAETEYALELAEDWELKGGKKAGAGILQTTAATDLGAAAEKIAVLDGDGTVRYRTPAELLADLGADYIVEQGTSGIWTYRKWNSGKAECWLESDLSLTGSTPVAYMNNSAYYSYATAYLPFTFKTQPSAVAEGSLGTGMGFVNVLPESGYSKVTVYVTGNQESSAITIRSMIVTGRWK